VAEIGRKLRIPEQTVDEDRVRVMPNL